MGKKGDSPNSTRERILRAAREAFARSGFAGTSTREIAVAADITPSLLFYHFPTKSDLYIAMVEEQLQHIGERLDVSLRKRQDIASRFEALVTTYIDCFLDDVPGLLVVNREFWVLPDDIEAPLGRLYRSTVTARIELLLKEARTLAHLKPEVDVTISAHAIDALLKSFLRTTRRKPAFKINRQEIAAQVLQYYLPGLMTSGWPAGTALSPT